MIQKELYADERIDRVNENIELIQKKNGLTFGTDAFLLAAYLRARPDGRAVELGTGTGIVSLLAAARARFAHVDAIEIQADFAELAARNVERNGLGDRVTVRHADVREVSAATLGYEVETVFANPPYMRTDSGKRNDSDYKYLARHEVCGGIEDFCAAARRLLKHGGHFVCVFRPDRLAPLMASLSANRLAPKRMTFVHADADAEPSMVLVDAVKGGADGLRITPPLFLYETADRGGERAMSARARHIYDTMSFEEEA